MIYLAACTLPDVGNVKLLGKSGVCVYEKVKFKDVKKVKKV